MPRYPLALALALAAAPARGDEPVEFNRDVRQILSDACFSCHGFDAKARKAKLRLDTPDGAYKARDGVHPVKAGDPKASEVWARITSADPDALMPPADSNKKLTAAQKDIIKKWIEQGAKYQKHWAFEPVARPTVGAGHPVDALLAARMAKAGLRAAAEADRPTLIRRVAFALTGLPPTVAEVDAYLADAALGAYERMVDRYLASPRFGEEMARHWLDVARYADTHGLHLDNERSLWGYRDWVVRAFNQNLPFDRFTVWQLAGDLLPNPTPDQLAATGFNRCNVTTGEGGSIDAEWVYRNAVDRTSTAVQAWLGLTAGCAVCHDHKFDPLSMREFYSLYAFFLSAADPALDGNLTLVGPFERLPTAAQTRTLETAIAAEAAARQKLDAAATAAAGKYVEPGAGIKAVRDVLFDDAFPPYTQANNTSRNAAEWATDPPFGAKSGRRVLRQANSFFHQDAITFRVKPPVVPQKGTFEAWVYLDPNHPPAGVTVQFASGKRVAWGSDAKDFTGSGGGRVGPTRGPLPKAGEWAKLTVPVEDLGLTPGNGISTLTLQEFGGVVYWDALALVGETNPAADPLESQAGWQKTVGKAAEIPTDAAKRTAFYLANVARPVGELASLRAAWERARADREAADAAIPATLIFRDLGMPREAFVMQRGQYDKAGEKVSPGVPAVLPPLATDPGKRPTRLDLANWVAAKENPLTARVQVNRVWQQLFGVGLVKTGGDFGSQGEPPSHPELLDFLAAEFADGWDTKKLIRLLVTSAAFKRDAAQAPADRAKDPENRLLSRGPRIRLDAEQLRDNALAVSGLINLEVGGRAVRPYQPPNIWEPLGFGDSNTRYYLQDHGGALYRRSLYTFLKRTAPAPFLANFDAPNREQLCSVRDRTNTPLQALQLMNDIQHVEAARALAERVVADGGATVQGRITLLYRTVLSRRPDAEELTLVTAALARQRAIYAADPAAAARLVRVGESAPRRAAPDAEVAAWTMIANLVLNLDETVMRN